MRPCGHCQERDQVCCVFTRNDGMHVRLYSMLYFCDAMLTIRRESTRKEDRCRTILVISTKRCNILGWTGETSAEGGSWRSTAET